jgi:glyoxylase-like metal-dependent hydrolase (beta-lactamase superfamily II)
MPLKAALFTVGSAQVARIEESLGPFFDPAAFLKGFRPEVLEQHRSWLVPDYYSPERQRMIFSVHSWVIRTRHHTILVDTCAGNHKPRPGFKRFDNLETPYLERMTAAGLAPEEVDFVLCTHLHIDHVGWNTQLESGRWVPTFPKARYVFSGVDRAHFDPARGGPGAAIGDGTAVFNDSVLPVIESGQALEVAPGHVLGDGLKIEAGPGHTPGHVYLDLTERGEKALFVGDIIHHPLQIIEPDWSTVADHSPEQAATSRRRVLERCVAEGALLCPAHFGRPHFGRVGEGKGGGFVWRGGA